MILHAYVDVYVLCVRIVGHGNTTEEYLIIMEMCLSVTETVTPNFTIPLVIYTIFLVLIKWLFDVDLCLSY